MNFLLIDQTLRTVLNAVSGLPVNVAQGAQQSQYLPLVGVGTVTDGHGNVLGTADNKAQTLTYDVIGSAGIGRDELRTRYDAAVLQPGDTYAGPDAPLGSIIHEVTGNRMLRIQVTCESFDADDGQGPVPVLEAIRTGISLPSVLDLLNAAGLAIQTKGTVHQTDYEDDNGRTVLVAVLELVFNAADGVEDIPETTIQTVDRPALTAYGKVNGT